MNEQLLEQIRPEQIVENRKVYSGEKSELCLYETFQTVERVNFGHLNNPVLLFMLSGKKIIHEDNGSHQLPFVFMPGESLVMAPRELVQIDFPDASPENPTRCLTLEIGCSTIRKVLNQMNQAAPEDEKQEYSPDEMLTYETLTDHQINNAIHRICQYYTQPTDESSRKLLIDHTLQELVILILQTKARSLLTKSNGSGMPRLEFIVDYIMGNLKEELSVDILSEKACMSKPTFHRYFKKTIGLSPADFINTKRMQLAKQMLSQGPAAVGDVGHAVGYQSTSHFIKSFKKFYSLTPKQFQKQIFNNS